MGERYQDAELTALARISEGRCLIYTGEVVAGVAMLDEAMVAVGADEVSAIATGDAYCTVIEGCLELFDVARAREWTAALSRWCDAQPELVLYRGHCLVHPAEILQLRRAWDEALEEVERALARLAEPVSPRVFGAAAYVRAELHRLRGEFKLAEDAYRQAGEQGRQPQPGLALLRLAQGRTDDAAAAIRRAEQEADDALTRARLLGPFVEIVLAAGDVAAAQPAAGALEAIAAELRQPYLKAVAAHATGMALLAADDPRGALCERCGGHGAGGTGWRRRTRRPGRACRSHWPAGLWATPTPPTWSSTPPGRHSRRWGLSPTPRASLPWPLAPSSGRAA